MGKVYPSRSRKGVGSFLLRLMLLQALLFVVCFAGCAAQCGSGGAFDPSSCPPASPSTSPPPRCVSPNDTTVRSLLAHLPYCTPMMGYLQDNGQGVLLPTDPQSLDWLQIYEPQLLDGMMAVYSLSRLLGMIGVFPATSRECLHAFLRFQCSQLFRACSLAPGAPPLPAAPCLDSCELMGNITLANGATCLQLIDGFIRSPGGFNMSQAQASRFLPPCDRCETGCSTDGSTPSLYGNPSFPDYPGNQTWQLPVPGVPGATFAYNVSCAYYPEDLFVQNNDVQNLYNCYLPWVAAPSTNMDGYCGLGCPLAMIPLSDYTGMNVLTAVFAWISYFVTFFVMATMICIPRYRRFPGLMILLCCLACHILAFTYVFVTAHGYKRVLCKDQITYWKGKHSASACIFQTLVVLFGSLFAVTTWTAIAVNSVISIALHKSSLFQSKWVTITELVICIGCPVAGCIAALGIGKFDGAPLSLLCFSVAPLSHKHHKFTADLVIAYIAEGICILIAVPCICITLWAMRNLQDDAKSRIARNVRVALFLVIFLALWAFAFADRFVSMEKGDKWGEDFGTYYVTPAIMAPSPRTPKSKQPSLGLLYASFLVFAIQGTLIGILFGSNKDVRMFWVERYNNVKAGRSFFSGITSMSGSAGKESSVRSMSSNEHRDGMAMGTTVMGGTYND